MPDDTSGPADEAQPICLADCTALQGCGDTECTTFEQFLLIEPVAPPTQGGTSKPVTGGYAALPTWYIVQQSDAVLARLEQSATAAIDDLRVKFPVTTVDPPRTGTGPGDYGRTMVSRDEELKLADDILAANMGSLRFSTPQADSGASPLVMHSFAPSAIFSAGIPFGQIDLGDLVEPIVDAARDFYTALMAATSNAIWAVGVDYEQCWQSNGYLRGNLVRSIPLTPGEQLEIELKTWDRQTTSETTVESVQLDLSTDVTGEEKWMLASKMAFASQTNASVTPSEGVQAGLGIPVQGMKANVGGNANLTANLSQAITHSTETGIDFIHDQVVHAAQSLKSVRTNTVETSREVGTESSTRQVISNTNRCHTLTYHYFDVLQEFEVTTRATGVDLCLLIPLPFPEITPAWVLCHSCYLRQVLPCDDYYAGLDAAAVLQRYAALQALAPAGLGASTVSPGAGSYGSEGAWEPTQPSALETAVQNALDRYSAVKNASAAPRIAAGPASAGIVAAIGAGAAQVMQGAEQAAGHAGQAIHDGAQAVGAGLASVGSAITQAAQTVPLTNPFVLADTAGPASAPGSPAQFVWRKVAEITSPEIFDALDFLAASWPSLNVPAAPAAELAVLTTFFGKLGDARPAFAKVPAAFGAAIGAGTGAVVGATAGAVAGGVVGGFFASEIPGVTTWVGVAIGAAAGATIGGAAGGFAGGVLGGTLGYAAGPVVSSLVDGVLRPLGLADTVPNDGGLCDALVALKAQLDSTVALLPTGAGGTGAAGDDAAQRFALRAYQQLQDQAAAQVEFDRLACHLRENVVHYMQGLWKQLPDYDVLALLRAAGVPDGVAEPRLAGFVGGLGAVRVADLDWLQAEAQLDWTQLAQNVLAGLPAQPPSTVLRLPTPGMVVEAALGACDACEPFIDEHRTHDLAYRAAEVELIQARARQATAEAERFERRLAEDVLTDPTPYEGADVELRIDPGTDG